MEKEIIIVNYKGSGIRNLYTFSVICYILAAIMVLIGIVNGNDSALPFLACLAASFASVIVGAILKGLATIVEVAICKGAVMEQRYEFKNAKDVVSK